MKDQLSTEQSGQRYLYVSPVQTWQSIESPTQDQLAMWARSELNIYTFKDGQFSEVASGRGFLATVPLWKGGGN